MVVLDPKKPPPSEDESNATEEEDDSSEDISEQADTASNEVVKDGSGGEVKARPKSRDSMASSSPSEESSDSSDSIATWNAKNPPSAMTIPKVAEKYIPYLKKTTVPAKPKSKGKVTSSKRPKSKEVLLKNSTKKSTKTTKMLPVTNPVRTKSKSKSYKPPASRVKSKPMANPCRTKSKSTSYKPSKPTGGKTSPITGRTMKTPKPKSKGQVKSKGQGTNRPEVAEKSVRKPKPPSAKQMQAQISDILSKLKMQNANDEDVEPSESTSASSTKTGDRSFLPETKNKATKMKVKVKTKITKSYKSKKVNKGQDCSKSTKQSTKSTKTKAAPMHSSDADDSSSASADEKTAQISKQAEDPTGKDPTARQTETKKTLPGPTVNVTEGPPTNDELEDLNDELTDLNTSIATLRHSYGSIIRSLMNMQTRRGKKAALAPVTTATGTAADNNKTGGTAEVQAQTTIDDICQRVSVDYEHKYNMDRFLDGHSRDGVFEELFREVNEINVAMAHFKTLFPGEGYFLRDVYEKGDWKFSRAQYTSCLKVIKDLSKVVTTILKAYNTDLLDMFRINSTAN